MEIVFIVLGIFWVGLFVCGICTIVSGLEDYFQEYSWYDQNCLIRFDDFVKLYEKKLSLSALFKNKIIRIFSIIMFPTYILLMILFFILIAPLWFFITIINNWINWVNQK